MIIAGDFNLNILNNDNETQKLNEFMEKHSLNFLIPSGNYSTNGNTQIDLCMSNNTLDIQAS